MFPFLFLSKGVSRMEKFEPNSHKYKQEQQQSADKPKIEKVVTGPVTVRKKNELKKIASTFISEEAHNVKNYILMDVLIPAIKNAIEDVVTNGIRMILRGETAARKSDIPGSRFSYNKCYNDNKQPSVSRSARGMYYDDIVLKSRAEAETVLEEMDHILDRFGKVSINDLNDLVGRTGEYTDSRYGWTNLSNAKVVRTYDGYLLDLPKAMPLD